MNWHSFQCYFCGGETCRHEDYTRAIAPIAIHGLHSNFVTENIIASQRLSSRLIQQFNIYQQFKNMKVYAVLNLQEQGEHPHCGDGIISDSGFSYLPEELMSHQSKINLNFD
jgi:protein tyrosine phosphatase domain-containing protein 1